MASLTEQIFTELLPSSLKIDPFIVALGEAVEIELKSAYSEAETLANLHDVDNLPESLLDYLAYQKHVDFYDYTYPIELKRKLVKDSTHFHRIKGTPAAVEQLIEAVFGDGQVEEWFEYGGDPYKFRVTTLNQSATNERAQEFINAINSVKNTRSLLESVILLETEQTNLYWGGVVHIGSNETYRQVK
jgi:phage tail P2-like protein